MNFKSNKKEVLKAIEEAGRRTLEAIGVFVVGEAVVRTPVDTGNLRNSINHQVNDKEKYVAVGTNVEYAPYVEKGTSRQKAQPYLTPAAEENVKKIKKLASEMMKID